MHRVDTILINPSALKSIYQKLSSKYSAIEPPVWLGLIAGFLKKRNISTEIIDCEGDSLTVNDVVKRLEGVLPKLIVIVVYGQQPSASTQNMHGTSQICTALKQYYPNSKILLVGTHVAALPAQTLEEEQVDFVCTGEGPYTIEGLLQGNMQDELHLKKIPGLWFKSEGKPVKGADGKPIQQNMLCHELPEVPWQSLPMKNYRAHNWHSFGDIDNRSPYASIYTSLGCPFNCNFCCINAPFGGPGFRYWDPEHIINEIDVLVNRYGVRNIKIIDEMFVLKEQHFLKLCHLLIERNYDLNIWAYSRIDSIRPRHLEILKKAGINWLVLGIESHSQFVRTGSNKGRFTEQDIFKTVKMIQDAGIYVHGNYIFGLPDDDLNSMKQTLELAKELNTEMANFYSVMAYPGSGLYDEAVTKGWELPDSWLGFAQHSYECTPLRTDHLSAADVLRFRDNAWKEYFTSAKYLNSLNDKFGEKTMLHVQELTGHDLKRKLLGQ